MWCRELDWKGGHGGGDMGDQLPILQQDKVEVTTAGNGEILQSETQALRKGETPSWMTLGSLLA
jgi:hypothetical protein